MSNKDTSQDEPGPFPYTRHVDHEEHAAALALYGDMLPGKSYGKVAKVSHGSGQTIDWVFLEVPLPHKPGRHVVIALPPNGSTADAFSYVVLAWPEEARSKAAIKKAAP